MKVPKAGDLWSQTSKSLLSLFDRAVDEGWMLYLVIGVIALFVLAIWR